MAARRPCRICKHWFHPDPRVGDRQRACGRAECQRERHRRSCVEWHQRNPTYDRETRLRRRLVTAPPPAGSVPPRVDVDPLGAIDWEVARDEIGLEMSVVVEETARVLVRWTRDAMPRSSHVVARSSGDDARAGRRDAMVLRRGGP